MSIMKKLVAAGFGAAALAGTLAPAAHAAEQLHYGAIAVASDGSFGRAWDYSSWAAADQKALDACPRSDCKVLTHFVNSCGAIAYNPNTNVYWGGNGATPAEAVNNAIANAGGGRWITWVCTTR